MEERTPLGHQWAAPSPVHRTMRPLVWADARATIGEGALLLHGSEHSCVLVRLPAGLGIATDHDFRMSLANASLSREAPLSTICSVPIVTVTEHTDAPAALLKMVEQGIHHLVVTTDILLADRCLKAGATVLAPTGKPFTTSSIGAAIATRAIMSDLRSNGDAIGGPTPFSKTDRSRFLQALDAALVKLVSGAAKT